MPITSNLEPDLESYEDFDLSTSLLGEVDQTLSDNAVYLFSEDFSKSSVAKAIKFILSKNFLPTAKRPEYITLMIMSEGGDLGAAFALVDVIRGSRIPVHTVGVGVIASAALITFMAGEPGYRTITPNTSILSHQFSWGNMGKMHELVATNKEVQLTQKRLLDHIKHCTGITDTEVIKQYLLPPSDVWLSAREAVKFGIADKVVSHYSEK